MQKNGYLTLFVGLIMVFSTGCGGGADDDAISTPSKIIDNDSIAVFPGAEGFGIYTTAGRGGTIYKVTNLQSSGSGSLRACITAKGPRTCIFEVSGYIQLANDIGIYEPYLTIAGQTAPSPGITIRGGGLVIFTHDILIQHVRVRIGDDPVTSNSDNRDALGLNAGFGEVYNIVIDHCSFSWATDEIISMWFAGVHDITISNSIVSEGLNHSIHPEGYHSMGILVSDHAKNIAIIKNLIAHNLDRNPLIEDDSSTLIVNNVMYNTSVPLKYLGTKSDSPLFSTAVENVIIPGSDTRSISDSIMVNSIPSDSVIYLSGNYSPKILNNPLCANDAWCIAVILESQITKLTDGDQPPVWTLTLQVRSSDEATGWVLLNAGARPTDRDTVDERIVNDVINNTGQLIDCVASGESVQHVGEIQSGSTLGTAVISADSRAETDALTDYKIRLSSTNQVRKIISNDENTKVVTVDSNWDVIPAVGSHYTIFTDCSSTLSKL